jgi:hypothetical protein
LRARPGRIHNQDPEDIPMKLLIIGLLTSAFALPALAAHPCHDKREAKHTARKALHECIQSWTKEKVEPTDDCQAKLQAFVQAARETKACVAEQHAKRAEGKAEKEKK